MPLYLQDAFKVPLVIQLTDDEKCMWKNLTVEESRRLARENAKDIIACGFDVSRTFIFSDFDYVGGANLYKDATCSIVHKVYLEVTSAKHGLAILNLIPVVDILFKYLGFFLEDDNKLEHIRTEYGSGRMLTGEIKKRLTEVLTELVERHRRARAAVTDEMVDAFMAVRPLPNITMASIVGENWGHVDGQDRPENSELSAQNYNLLMSLLDETQIDECDDERLTKVIQSLQDELDCVDHFAWEGDVVDCESSIDDESYGQGFPSMAAVDRLDSMDMKMVPTSPRGGDHMGGWCMDHHGQGVIDGDGGLNDDQLGFIKNNNSSLLLEVGQDFWHGHFEYV
ncbi:hypothetical protein SASPL_139566 [Salvia splendens]|uniref:Tryptophanyl-tRNA synthetase n=1 Tax=Salvia splendens TaxID=180675 RepID=A0A8X8ZBN1_SALSN|nr:hypothetical protein SASPL_139566 [Salvia splendens]